MPVDPSTVAKGKCYATSGGQVRRVLGISGNDVTYESRGKRMVAGSWSARNTAKLDTFAAAVDKDVPCHYDPDTAAENSE
jgi:hypothetical protein